MAGLASVAGCAMAVGLGTAAVLVVADQTPQPAAFLSAGIFVTAVSVTATMLLTLRRTPAPVRRRVSAAAALSVSTVLAAVWLVPLTNPPQVPDSTPVQYWQLSTGSRLAYLHIPASGPTRRPWPVVVLHGGPGIPDLRGDAAFWGQLAADGFDVYLYAQLGAGPSSRLTDPAGYSPGRDVADLEQIRHQLGANQLILIGHSYGGTLAAAYLAAHPDHVVRLILSSPGPLDPTDHSGDNATDRLTAGQRLKLYPLVLQPRALLGYLLLQVNPRAAHAYLPDAEADDRNDAVLTVAQQGLQCRPAPRPRVSGSGFYRLQYPQSATAPPTPDLRPQLSGRTTRVLVFKGGCDYQSWASAEDYRHTLPHTTLTYLPNAGHNLYQDQPQPVIAVARAFLTGRPLPVPSYTATTPPPDYQHH